MTTLTTNNLEEMKDQIFPTKAEIEDERRSYEAKKQSMREEGCSEAEINPNTEVYQKRKSEELKKYLTPLYTPYLKKHFSQKKGSPEFEANARFHRELKDKHSLLFTEGTHSWDEFALRVTSRLVRDIRLYSDITKAVKYPHMTLDGSEILDVLIRGELSEKQVLRRNAGLLIVILGRDPPNSHFGTYLSTPLISRHRRGLETWIYSKYSFNTSEFSARYGIETCDVLRESYITIA